MKLLHINLSHTRLLGNIDAFIKENNNIYIPGSELKGAIRTAVAYHLVKKDNYYAKLKSALLGFQSRFPTTLKLLSTLSKRGRDLVATDELKKIHENELKNILGNKRMDDFKKGVDQKVTVNRIKRVLIDQMKKSGVEENLQKTLFRTEKNVDAKFDMMKLLRVSDSDFRNTGECLFITDLKTVRTSRPFPLFQEFCRSGQVFTCEDFSLEHEKDRGKASIPEKLGFNEGQRQILTGLDKVLECCCEFSDRLLKEEIYYFTNKYKNPEIVRKLQIIKNQNELRSPVIRIGKNEGYSSLTLGLVIKDRDPELYDNMLCHVTQNTSYTGDFPKTRKIVNLPRGDVDTCGWVKLS